MREEIEEVKTELEEVKEQSFAYELLKDARKTNKRQFIIILVVLGLWFVTIGYLVYVLNDISVIEETEVSQDNENGYNSYVGNDGDIIYGKANSKEN